MRNKNKGFSMIELILVIAIMGIATAMISIGFGYITHANTKSTAKRLNAELSQLQINTMSRKEHPYMYLYKMGDGYYIKYSTKEKDTNLTSSNGKLIGNSKIVIRYKGYKVDLHDKKMEEFSETLRDGTPIRLGFKKDSGAFIGHDGKRYTEILVTNTQKNASSYTVKMYQATGKHYLE